MQDRPSPADLLALTAAFLRAEIMPELEGAKSFGLRVAINALDLVARSLQLQGESDAAEQGRLAALLGHEGDLETLNRVLCERVTGGTMTLATPGFADHLWATTLEKLAVDQPTYASYRREAERASIPRTSS